jgi:XTP/dITP diphosphohydrolase
MGMISLVVPGSGAPELWSLEAWAALSRAPVHAVPSLASEALEAIGIEVTKLPIEAPRKIGLDLIGGAGGGGHDHGEMPPEIEAAADAAVAAATDHDICVLEHDERLRRALMKRAVDQGLAIEFVIGAQPVGHSLLEVVRTMAILHGPDGCPWDREQTHASLAKHLIDEAYELIDAIESDDPAQIREELGDVLLQVVFHAQMARDAGTFDIDDVATTLDAKLKRRHPHVFSDTEVAGADEVVRNWDQIKREEKGATSSDGSPFEGVPNSLPALQLAQKLLRRAESAGLATPSPSAEEAGSLAAAATDEVSFGEALLALVTRARAAGVDAESALRIKAKELRASLEG